MTLLTTLLSGAGGGGGGSGSVTGIIMTPVVAASVGALTVTYANGSSGVGATLTNAGAQAAIQLDGISPTLGQRVLIKNQAAPAQNGIYTVTTVGTGATNWVLTRATDFDQASEMTAGAMVEVVGGTVNAGTVWTLTTTVVTVGTTAVTFSSINITTKVDQNGSPIYGADSVGTDSYAITLSPAPAAYTTGMVINFSAGTANTGGATLNVNGLGAKSILKLHDQALATGDIEAGQIVTVIYDGTNFQMQSQIAQNATPSGSLLAKQVFTSGSGATYTPTAGTNTAWIRMWGGGGAGGGAAGTTATSSSGGGGGSGGYVEHLLTGVTGTYTYTVGAGGTAGAAGNNPGGNGAASTFSGGSLSAGGGTGGGGSAAQAGATVVATGTGGAGGAATGGNIDNVGGATGGTGYCYLNSGAISGYGGASNLGNSVPGVNAPTNTSTAGITPGANTANGGSGGASFGTGGASVAGGAGAAGLIIIFEYS